MTTGKGEFRGGTVAIIATMGSGPDSLTPLASTLLARADVVLHDDLVDESVMSLCRDDATLYFVGRLDSGERTCQTEIDCQLVHYARMGLRVVRLTGEATFQHCGSVAALERQGIEFRFVSTPVSQMSAHG